LILFNWSLIPEIIPS